MIKRLGLTEGQAYTVVIAVALALVLAVAGIPPVLRDRVAPGRAAASPLTGRNVATTTTAPVAEQPPSGTTAPRLSNPSSPSTGAIASGPPPTIGTSSVGLPLLSIATFARIESPGAPAGLAVGSNGTVYVTTGNGTTDGDPAPSHVFAYDWRGNRTGDHTVNGQPGDHAFGLTGAAVSPSDGSVAVLQADAPRVLAVDVVSGSQRVLAEIPNLPACLVSLGANPCQQGAEDRVPFPASAAYDAAGNLYVTDPTQDTIWRLRPGAQLPDVWLQSPFFSLGDGPYGLAINDSGVEFTVGTTLDPASPAAGGLYRTPINADGSAGALTVVSLFARDERPGPLTIGASGLAYVVLRGTGAIVAIAPAGTREWRIDPPGGGLIPLDTPSALAIIPGQLLVANKGTTAGAANWAVLAVTVNEGPQP